jgi:hypothetical protein
MQELSQPAPQTRAAQLDASRLPHGLPNLTPLAQLKRMQRVLFQMSQDPDVDRREAAQVALAWERLEERKRIMVGKPAPKAVDMGYGRTRKRQGAAVQPLDVPTKPTEQPK